jgi:MscS family membrane protein
MVAMKWERRSNLALVILAILLILPAVSFTLTAHAQSQTTPEVTLAPEQVTTPEATGTLEHMSATPVPDQSPGESDSFDQSTVSGASASPLSSTILDWGPEQWIDLAISLLIFLVIAIFGWRIVIWLGKQIAGRTGTTIDDKVLSASRRPLQLISVILGFQVAYARLDFLRPSSQSMLNDVFFVLYTVLASIIVWVFIDSGLNFYQDKARENDADMKSIDRLLPLVRTFTRGLLVVVTIIILLHHFGIEITAVVAALGLTGFALSLAAKDTLTNIIAGLTIAVNRPFRINDRIYNKDVGGWVDVVEIGLRSTQVLTRDNRMVIIPNSDLSDDTVINYNFPDRSYRLQVDIDVAYDTDIKTTRQVLHDAVRQIDGVMADKPVQVLFVEFGESAMVFRVRWWIDDFADMRKINDRVYQAIQESLNTHNIVSPGAILDVNYHLDQQDADRLASAFQTMPPDESNGPDNRT